MTVDFYASEPHYFDHLAPTWLALDADARGRFFASPRCAERADRWCVPRSQLRPGRPGRGQGLVVVASHRDLRACRGRPIVLSQHGAGQQYSDGHPAYVGGRDNGAVVLFLCPNDAAAARWRAAYLSTPAVVVGCPKLDDLIRSNCSTGGQYPTRPGPKCLSQVGCDRPVTPHDEPRHQGIDVPEGAQGIRACRCETGNSRPPVDFPTVALSWHWDYDTGPPEGRWAWPHYAEAVADLRTGPWKLLGHSHPRAWRTLSRYYAQLGIEAVRDFDEVMERADLYVCDNSSTIYEFAATGRPVVLLNAPWYRRQVEHGLRFWRQASVGMQVDEPGELAATIACALEDPPEVADLRAEAVAEVYGVLDGYAAARAARAIEAAARREEEGWATRRVPA